jgi:hypothetical protein
MFSFENSAHSFSRMIRTQRPFLRALIKKGDQKGDRRVFLTALLVTALAKGAAFLPSYSIDDYYLILQDSPRVDAMLDQGRFGQAILSALFHLLQLEPAYSTVFFVTLAIFASALLATLTVRYWNLDRRRWLPIAAACVAVNHPFTTEIFTFHTALGTSMIALALFSILLIPRRWSPRQVLAGAGLFAFTLSIYQVVLHFCLMIVSMGAAIWWTRYLLAGARHGWPDRVRSLLTPRRILRHRNTALLACAALGTAGYAVLNAIVSRALDVKGSSRTALITFGEVPARARMVLEVLELRFLQPSPLMTTFSKGLLLLVLLTALAGLLWRTSPWRRPQAAALLLAVLALLAASLVWSVGILMILAEFWPVPRVMSHVGIFWAGLLAIAYLCFGRYTRQGLAVLATLIVLSFIGADNRILRDQVRVNARDMLRANRILERLETLPGFPDVAFVAIDGRDWRYPLRYSTTDHDLNISAFGADWSQVAILREVSGYDLEAAKDPGQIALAETLCRAVKPWPDPRSVMIRDQLAIVCMEHEP